MLCKDFNQDKLYFKNNFLVKSLLNRLIHARSFTINNIKRHISRYLAQQGIYSHLQPSLPKPHALQVREMFDPLLFRSGTYLLNPSSHTLKPSLMAKYHCLHCTHCSLFGTLQPSCYFSAMLRCITHGWHIPCNYSAIVPRYRVTGNYPAIDLFRSSVDAEFCNMANDGVIYPIARSCVRFLTPMNAIIKNSDKNRSRTVAGIHIIDQPTLRAASAYFVDRGLPKVKIRLTIDHTATGLNQQSYSPAFSYPSIADALRHVTPDCYMCVGDIQRYFHSYPTALDDRDYYCIEYGGSCWCYSKCCFGHTACPYYTSTFGAEYHHWFNSMGIPNSMIVDDWFTAAQQLKQVLAQMSQMSSVFESIGFTMQSEKYKYGQQVLFLGILIDSTTMTVRIDAVVAKSFRLELEIYLVVLIGGKHLDYHLIRPICGKLNWFAEILQSGRLHIHSFWNYLKHYKASYPVSMNILRSDFQWWISLLLSWENGDSTGLVFRIISSETLLSNPTSIYLVQSDASGTDGFGYFHSFLNSDDIQYVSKSWEEPLDDPNNSMLFELHALLDYLITCTIRGVILIWINDNESSTWAINKGNCKDPASRIVLTRILHYCDLYHLQVLALWVPREQNTFADYLSHLSTYLDRSTVSGHFRNESRPSEPGTPAFC